MKKLLSITIFSVVISTTLAPIFNTFPSHAITASDWKAGNIIDDQTFSDGNGMSVQQIQNFLNNKVPVCDTYGTKTSELGGGTRAQYGAAKGNPAPFTCLKDFYEVPKTTPGPEVPANNYGGKAIPSGAISAAQIIANAAQKYNINPKVLLVKVATESAGPLTSDDWPFLRQYTYAMGSHCPDSGPNGSANCDVNYSGFSMQMDSAASLMRWYLDSMTQPWWSYKKPYQTNSILWNVEPSGCGAGNVYIGTKATAALYTYTPYQPNQAALNNMYGQGDSCSAYGNRNFWRVFNDWFGSTAFVPPTSNKYIQNGNYVIKSTSGLALAPEANGTINGTRIIISSTQSTSKQWRITRDNAGYYTFINTSSGRALDVVSGSVEPGASLQLYDANGTCAQKWAAVDAPGNQGMVFKNACSGMALDISGATVSTSGSYIQTWSANSSIAQQWSLTSLDPAPAADGLYTISSPSGLVLDIAGGSTASETPLQIYPSNNSIAQRWQMTRRVDGTYSIKNPSTGKALDIASGNINPGGKVQMYDYNGTCAQQWYISQTTSGKSLTSSCSGLVLDVMSGAIYNPESRIQTYTPNGSPAQIWQFTPWTDPYLSTPGLEGTYTITLPSNLALDVAGGSTANGARVQIYSRNNTPAQTWQLIGQADGSYSIKNPASGKYLDVMNGSLNNSAALQLYDGNGSCAQRWNVQRQADGSHKVMSACKPNLVIDVRGGAIYNASTLTQLYDYNGTNAQKWHLSR